MSVVNHTASFHSVALAATLLFCIQTPVRSADFAVSASSFDFSYTINTGANNPTLTLVRGRTYTFEVNACSCHPFKILGAPASSLTNNDTFSGIITFNVPLDVLTTPISARSITSAATSPRFPLLR